MRIVVDGEVIRKGEVVPRTTVHSEVLEVGEVGREARRTGSGGHGGALELLDVFGEIGVLLAEITRFESVTSDHFFLLEQDAVDVLLALLLRRRPLVLFSFPLVLSDLHLGECLFQFGDDGGEVLLLFLQPFGVLLLALAGIESASG